MQGNTNIKFNFNILRAAGWFCFTKIYFLVIELSDNLLKRRKLVKDELVVVINKLFESSAGYSKRISREIVLNVDTRSYEAVHGNM